jgi:ribosomal silencing factor RsfS
MNYEGVPWYLRHDDSIKAKVKEGEEIPPLPENSPPSLEPLLNCLSYDLGMVDIQIFDLRSREVVSSFGPDTILVLCSGKSSKHVAKAGRELILELKHNQGALAQQEGILTSNFLKLQNRRARKKAERAAGRHKQLRVEGIDSARSGSWIVVDSKVDGVIIHLFSKERREELGLERMLQEDYGSDDFRASDEEYMGEQVEEDKLALRSRSA